MGVPLTPLLPAALLYMSKLHSDAGFSFLPAQLQNNHCLYARLTCTESR